MRVIFSVVLVFAALLSNAQECVRSGSLVETDVSITGTASLIYRGDSMVVSLSSDFLSDAGPDLDVYLSDDPNPVATGVRLEALRSLSGAQVYDVPSNINIDDFKYISIHCTQYNHLYGYALLNSATGDCAGALESPEVKLNQVKVFANNKSIRVKTDGLVIDSFKTEIYSQSGSLVHTSTSAKTRFEVDTAGIYFVKLYSKNIVRTEKVIIK